MFSLLVPTFLVLLTESIVNINDLGDEFAGGNCLKDSLEDVEISFLSDSDESKVTELRFLMALYRHGIRFPTNEFENIIVPPEGTTWPFTCSTRNLINNIDNGRASDVTFDVHFSDDEERYTDSNCEWTQIANDTPQEMVVLAQKIVERFYTNERRDLGTRYNDRRDSGKGNRDNKRRQKFSSEYRNTNDIEFYANWVNRVYQSHIYFAEEILNTDGKKQTVRLNTHNPDSSPWRVHSLDSCTNLDVYQEWNSIFADTATTTAIRENYLLSAEGQDARNSYAAEGGNSNDLDEAIEDLFYWYCSAVDVPLTEETFKKVDNYWVTYDNLYGDTQQEIDLQYCAYHNMNRPAYYEVRERILNALNNKNAPRAYMVGSQSFTTRRFLWGLKLFFDGENFVRKVAMNEMITLEVYTANDNNENIDYYFRFTRNGEFLRYHLCNNYYDDNNTQLCDLNILLNGDFADAMDLRDYETNFCPNVLNDCVCGLC